MAVEDTLSQTFFLSFLYRMAMLVMVQALDGDVGDGVCW